MNRRRGSFNAHDLRCESAVLIFRRRLLRRSSPTPSLEEVAHLLHADRAIELCKGDIDPSLSLSTERQSKRRTMGRIETQEREYCWYVAGIGRIAQPDSSLLHVSFSSRSPATPSWRGFSNMCAGMSRGLVSERVAHHIAREVGLNKLRTQAVKRRTIVVTDGNDVALSHSHAGELSVKRPARGYR